MLSFVQVCALSMFTGAPAFAQAPPAAVVQQDLLPSLEGRFARAQARAAAAESWFAGTSTFEAAWPAWAGTDVLDLAFLRAARRQSSIEAEARAVERIAPLPEEPQLAEALRRSRTRALDEEDRFSALRDRFLAGVLAGLTRAPGLEASTRAPRFDAWQALLEAAGDDANPEQADAATQAMSDRTRLVTAQRLAVRALTIPGDGSLAEWVDEQVAGDVSAETLVTLAAIQPLLPEYLAAPIGSQLAASAERRAAAAADRRQRQLEELTATLESPPPLTEADTLAALTAAVDAAKTAIVGEDDPDHDIREVELAIAEKRLAILSGQVAEDASAAQRRAQEAREQAEATRAEGAREDKSLSALRNKLLAVQGAVAEVYEREATRREEDEAALVALRSVLDERIEAGANALTLSPTEANRQSTIDRAFLDLRTSVRALYERLDALRALELEHRADKAQRLELLQGWPHGRGSAELIKLDDAFGNASDNLIESLDNRTRTLKATRDEVYRLLDVARDNRRELRIEASSAARAQARRDFFPELKREVEALPGQLNAGVRELAISLIAVPAFVANIDALWALFLGSFELVLLIGLWGVARRQMTGIVQRGLTLLEERRGVPLEGDRTFSVAQLTALGHALIDVVTALFLFSRLGAGLEFFSLVLLVFTTRAALTAAPLLARSALASPEQMHPSLRLVMPSTEALAARTLWLLAAWAMLSKMGTYAMVELLDADRMHDVVGIISSVAFWMLFLAAILTWGPVASATIARQSEHSALTGWAGKGATQGIVNRFLSFPRYLVAIGVVVTQVTVNMTGRLIEGRAAFAWLQSALARRQLKSDEPSAGPRRPVPARVSEALDRCATLGMPRRQVDDRVQEALRQWHESGRRGLVSLIGDDGSGKGEVLRRLTENLGEPISILTIPNRLDDPPSVISFLSAGFGVEATSERALIAALNELPSRVVAVESAQLLFLRCVGGYAALQSLVSVMTATAENHFWILSVHGPAWDYLMGISARLKLDAFRDHIRLTDATSSELSAWLERETTHTGVTLSYEGLATTGLLGGDEGLAEKRARAAYWRLLADASGGIPRNAVDLWARSLSLQDGDRIDVRMFDAPSADDIQNLSDDTLFTLKALYQHERLTTDELAKVLNRRPAAARSSAKHLVHLGLAEHDPADLTYGMVGLWVPAVRLLLRQKHFLYSES